MTDGDSLTLLTAAVILLVVILASPTVGVVDLTGEPAAGRLDGGNATVTNVSVQSNSVQLVPGRFGTDVYYLRLPDARVTVENVTGTPRLVYRVTFPSLSFDRVHTRILDGETGTVRLAAADRAFRKKDIQKDAYAGEVVVRVQSFDVDVTLYRRTVIVEASTG